MANPTEIPLENILLYDADGKYLGTAAQNQSATTGQKTATNGNGFLSFLSGLTTALGPALGALFPNGIGGGGTTPTAGTGGINYVPTPQTNNSDSTVLLVGAALVAVYFITQDKPRKKRRI